MLLSTCVLNKYIHDIFMRDLVSKLHEVQRICCTIIKILRQLEGHLVA
jgi:hypothetical protein